MVWNAAKSNNFCPVSLLSINDQVFEKLIHERLLLYFDNYFEVIYKCQFDFKKGYSTEEVVLNVVNFISDGLDIG